MFAARTDIAHHTDWIEGAIELVTLIDGPAGLGTTWEHFAVLMGKAFVTANVCNAFEPNRRFGWQSGKPFVSQFTYELEPVGRATRLDWTVDAEETGIVQLAEPLVERQIRTMLERSLARLQAFL